MKSRRFVDIQVNGYSGVNFSDPGLTEHQFLKACEGLIHAGTEVFLPTLVTCSLPVYEHNLQTISHAVKREGLQTHIPGIHLEGPFISPEPGAVGAHNPAWVLKPNVSTLEALIKWSDNTIRILTVAPESEGSEAVIKACVQYGIVGALGHTIASDDDIHRAVNAGARLFTHLGNGIPNLLPRHPNTIWSALAEDGLYVSLITDGHHLPKEFIKTVIAAKGMKRTIVVSDGTHVSGMPPGIYPGFDGDIVLEENGKLHDPSRGCLAGSSATIADCVEFLEENKLMDSSAINAACNSNPMRLISLR